MELIGLALFVFAVGVFVGTLVAKSGRAPIVATESEIETLRLQLSACGVAAMGNTRGSVGNRLERRSPFWSASYSDVCSAVDREMRLRDERDTEVREFIGWLSGDITELHRVEVPRLAESWVRFQAQKAIAGADAVVCKGAH